MVNWHGQLTIGLPKWPFWRPIFQVSRSGGAMVRLFGGFGAIFRHQIGVDLEKWPKVQTRGSGGHFWGHSGGWLGPRSAGDGAKGRHSAVPDPILGEGL